jgi:predicted  nucleic acid-binding Zn-ribbon protein
MSNKDVILDIQNISEQISKIKKELEQAKDTGEVNQLRKDLLKLQLQQLWELDEMEWYVEIDGTGIFDKC